MMKKLLIASTFLLASCGFKPVHSVSKMDNEPAFKNIKVELIEPKQVSQREAGYYVQQHLYDRLGQNAGPHILKIKPRVKRRPYGLTSNDVASRYDMTITVGYDLVNAEDGKILNKGSITATSTFGSSRDPYARISSEKNASEQVARDAADRIIVRLASHYRHPDRYAQQQAAKRAADLAKKPIKSDEAIETLPETP